MKPNTFKNAYKQEIEKIQPHEDQLASLIHAVEAEELALTGSATTAQSAQQSQAQSTADSAQAQDAQTAGAANVGQGWTASSPVSTPTKSRKRFWKDWSTEGKFTATFSGLVGAAAMLFLGILAWSTVTTVLPSPGEPSTHPALQTGLPTEGMVALIPAGNDYENVYAILDRVRARDEERLRIAQEQRESSGGLFDGIFGSDSDDVWADDMPLTDDGWTEEAADVEAPTSAPDDMSLSAESDSSARRLLSEEPDFSDTNVQVQGVQEADIIKTDGHYIYALSAMGLSILEANGGNPQVLSTLDFHNNSTDFHPGPSDIQMSPRNTSARGTRGIASGASYSKMYLEGDRLIALWSITNDLWTSVHFPEFAGVDIFDISDPSQPRHLNDFQTRGSLVNSRMIGSTLYLVSTVWIEEASRNRNDPTTFIPFVSSGNESAPMLTPESNIRISPYVDELRTKYTHIVAIDTTRNGQLASQAALLGGSDDLYMSTDNLFLLSEGQIHIPAAGTQGSGTGNPSPRGSGSSSSSDDIRLGNVDVAGNATTVTRVELNDGQIDIGNSRRLPGIVNNQFSLDESDGVLRIITAFTRWEHFGRSGSGQGTTGSSEEIGLSLAPAEEWGWSPDFTDTTVWTLDERLEVIGSIDGFGIDEDVYSARFMGDIVYFVTFREIDPVYAVDLSDPANPRFLSELKIPGFSEYLHPWHDGLLFGFGRDACEITGIRGGLKLSMFDISNPKDVTREHYLILDDFRNSDASSNHRAILVNPERNLIAFPADDFYLIYSYNERRGFELVEELPLISEGDTPARGLFIDDMFYVFELGGSPNVEVFMLPSFRTWDFIWL
ncbi:MAG: beta-propeller domain-containing protein [Coriobacteriia bacterium]|nr:beta-propeller domain-containing protein [Coriobacteriia bacterium]